MVGTWGHCCWEVAPWGESCPLAQRAGYGACYQRGLSEQVMSTSQYLGEFSAVGRERERMNEWRNDTGGCVHYGYVVGLGVCEGKWECGNWFHPCDTIMVFFCMQQQASVKAGQCQTTPNNVISEPSTSTAVINKALIDTLNRLQSAVCVCVCVCVCAKVCGGLLVCVCVGGGGRGGGETGEYGISFITITNPPVGCYHWVAVTLCVWRSIALSWGSWCIRVSPVPSRLTSSHSFGLPWTWWCSHAELARIVYLYPFSLKPSNTACIFQ